MIAVNDKYTTRASVGSKREGHLLAMVTPTTVLRSVGRVDLNSYSASFFRFAEQHTKESRPRRVTNAFSKAMVMYHPIDLQIFNRNEAVGVYDLSTGLVRKVGTLETYPLMYSGYYLAPCFSFFRPLFGFREFPLSASQFLFFCSKKAGIFDLFARAEGSKAMQPYINPDLVRIFRQYVRLYVVTAKATVPFSSAGTDDSASFGIDFDGSMQLDFDMAYF
jgi:hypothetical protein